MKVEEKEFADVSFCPLCGTWRDFVFTGRVLPDGRAIVTDKFGHEFPLK